MEAALASVFEFLFKYRPVVFERGTLVFGGGWGALAMVGVGLLVAAPALVGTARLRAGARPRDRAVLLALRSLALLLVAACLFRPALLVSAAAPQRNVLALVVDDSRSMRIADVDGRPRADVVRTLLAPDGALVRELGERFTVRTFRFASDAARTSDVGALAFDGARSRVEGALRAVRQELAGVPLAGIVLVTDGADNADVDALAPTSPDGRPVPVFTVGVGSERLATDVEITRVDVPRTALRGGAITADVTIAQSGLAGESAQLIVEDDARIIATHDVVLPGADERRPVRVSIPAEETGVRRLRFRVAPQAGELLTENNAREALVTVRDGPERILYVEGEPRFEFKFLRRAVADDEQLQVVGLQRTAEDKFLRLGVDDSTELRAGFPATREELFRYRAIVLGSIEASHFTAAQHRLLADFVSERGGGLLALGGRRSFREGGWAGTALAEAMPVQLDEGAPEEDLDAPPSFLAEVQASPTAAGRAHAAVQVADTPEASAERWRTLPPLTTVNRIRGLKPGAVTLLAAGSGADAPPMLAFQRYGRGLTMAFPVQDSWLWQMHADVPLEDATHERFWRQLLRWLVSEVPDRAVVAASSERLGAGEPATLRAEVRDSAWQGVGDARAVAHVTGPDGATREVALQWTGTDDGEYRGVFTPDADGVHAVRVDAELRDGERVGAGAAFVRSGDGSDEFFDAGVRTPFLRRLAAATGGRHYTPATAAALARDVVYTESGNTVVERKELWDMPVVLFALVGLLGGEWAYRRGRGLV